MKEFREGAQKAYCTYARLNVRPVAASRSRLGVCARLKLNAPRFGRMSSTVIKRTFLRAAVGARASFGMWGADVVAHHDGAGSAEASSTRAKTSRVRRHMLWAALRARNAKWAWVRG